MDSGRHLTHNSGWAIGLGIFMIVLGIVAIFAPATTSLAAELVLGWLFIFGGIFQGIYAFQHNRRGSSLALNLVLAVIALIAGILLVANPLAGIVSLTLLVGVYFFIDGVLRVILAFQLKPLPRWGWVLVNGILSIVLGILIWSQWPFNAVWLLGLLVGIGLLMNGLAALLYGASAQNLQQDF
ncbi:hypothetical protein C7271_07650 [filamentous cyanobacterium CCP5]|nr:hypothetical protein C7271_07650 [filamentous cyanobacterium CCP5]